MVRLEQYEPAQFDQAMAQRMSNELFEEWISEELAPNVARLMSSDTSAPAANASQHDQRCCQCSSEHPAFAGLSDAVLNAIQQDASLLDFQPGQPLSAGDVIPHQVLLILSGQARLLVRHRERTQTLRKAGAGELVGLASLVRAAGCEAVTASTPVQALAVTDRAVLHLLETEPSFRTFCQQTIWPAELFALLKSQIQDLDAEAAALRDLFHGLLADVQLVAADQEAVNAALDAGQRC